MTGTFVAAYLHLVLTVFLVGYVLYWVVMVMALRRSHDPAETLRLLAVANRARWPHVVVPWALRLPLPFVGWAFFLLLLVTGLALTADRGWSPILVLKLALVAVFAISQVILTRRPVPALITANFFLALVIVVLSGLLTRVSVSGRVLYGICVSLHLLAATLWLGHMFVWSLVVGPAIKRVEPPATAALLRERSLVMGPLGWPALAVLIATGLYLLDARGISPGDLLTGAAFTADSALAVKLPLVGLMVVYQAVWGHREVPIAVYGDMLAALLVLGASVVLVQGWTG